MTLDHTKFILIFTITDILRPINYLADCSWQYL